MTVKGEISIFEPLPMRRRSLIATDSNQYQISTSSGEIKEIKADTAYEAVIKSGQTSIIKIERVFNSRRSLFEQSKFIDESPQVHAANPEESIHDRINRRKNPIISAGELDELMRAARAYADAPSSSAETEIILSTPAPELPSSASGASLAMETPPVPVLGEAPPTGEGVSAVGLDVHGDGFDEIIPAAPQVKAARSHPEPKPASTAETAPPVQPALPEKELSPEEVERLLQSKPE